MLLPSGFIVHGFRKKCPLTFTLRSKVIQIQTRSKYLVGTPIVSFENVYLTAFLRYCAIKVDHNIHQSMHKG